MPADGIVMGLIFFILHNEKTTFFRKTIFRLPRKNEQAHSCTKQPCHQTPL